MNTGERVKLYHSKRWQMKRRQILARDNYTCQQCGAFNADQVDHIMPLSQGGDQWAESNLRVLCRRCHALKSGHEADAHRATRQCG